MALRTLIVLPPFETIEQEARIIVVVQYLVPCSTKIGAVKKLEDY